MSSAPFVVLPERRDKTIQPGLVEPASGPIAGQMTVSRIPPSTYVGWGKAFEDLAARASTPNPFMSPAAVAAVRMLHEDDRIVILAAHRHAGAEPELVGLWCFVILREVWTCGVAVLQTPMVPLYDTLAEPVLDRGQARRALQAIIEHVRQDKSLPGIIRATSWPVGLTPLLPASVRTGLAERWTRAMLDSSSATDAEGYLKAAMGSQYKKRLSQERALGRSGALAHVSLRGAAAAARFDDFVQLEAEGWKGRAGTALARQPFQQRYVRAVIAGLAETDRLTVDMLTLDGRPVAIGLLPESAGTSVFWKTAFDETFARHSPGALLDLAVTRRLFAERRPSLDSGMMEFTQADSQPWAERLELCRTVLDVRSGPAAICVRLGDHARRHARRLRRQIGGQPI